MSLNGTQGLVAADETVAQTLRRYGKPVVLVVNKGDTRIAQEQFDEFYRLGLAPQVLLSAEHGVGVGELCDALIELLFEDRGEDDGSGIHEVESLCSLPGKLTRRLS